MKSLGKKYFGWQAVIRLVSLAALLMAAPVLMSCASSRYAVKNSERLMADYSAKTSSAEKLVFLKKLLHSGEDNAFNIFYSLLAKAEDKDVHLFREACAAEKSVGLLLYMGKFFNDAQEAEIVKTSGLNPEVRQETANAHLVALVEKVNSLAPEIEAITKNNSGALISAVKKAFFVEKKFNLSNVGGALSCLKILKERGFELLLDSISRDGEENLASIILAEFGSDAVIPVIKAYENPASSDFKKDLTMRLITMFSQDDYDVLDKLVEAYKHGPYFPPKPAKKDTIVIKSIDQAMDMALKVRHVEWFYYFEYQFKGNSAAVNYIAKNHLSEVQGQADLINLLLILDFPTVLPYLGELDPNKISPQSLELIFSACALSSGGFFSLYYGSENDPDAREKFELFSKIFLKCGPERRAEKLYNLYAYPADLVASFFTDNFKDFSDKEKEVVIFEAGNARSMPTPGRNYPLWFRTQVFEKIRPFCNDAQKKKMDDYLKYYY